MVAAGSKAAAPKVPGPEDVEWHAEMTKHGDVGEKVSKDNAGVSDGQQFEL